MSWYTWVFSGLGSAAVVSVFTVLYRKYISNRSTSPYTHAIATNQHVVMIVPPPVRTSTEPTPIQISGEIEAVLPFDREHAKDKYIGLNVLWKVRFASVKCWNDTSIEDGAVANAQRCYFICFFGETPYY
jgi:hypothetical protein